ncbi:hypothetical protein D3OALGB2SA_4314 [Olavius algarvensis associated proteobacterium Delta 3]|nr:hypothetical protein D3OALGB2SA_4314 [Olavius algarvensis associated proteobacterium Delta 3]
MKRHGFSIGSVTGTRTPGRIRRRDRYRDRDRHQDGMAIVHGDTASDDSVKFTDANNAPIKPKRQHRLQRIF